MSRGDNKQITRGNIQKPGDPELVADIRRMIEETRATVAATVNARRNYSAMASRMAWIFFGINRPRPPLHQK